MNVTYFTVRSLLYQFRKDKMNGFEVLDIANQVAASCLIKHENWRAKHSEVRYYGKEHALYQFWKF